MIDDAAGALCCLSPSPHLDDTEVAVGWQRSKLNTLLVTF